MPIAERNNHRPRLVKIIRSRHHETPVSRSIISSRQTSILERMIDGNFPHPPAQARLHLPDGGYLLVLRSSSPGLVSSTILETKDGKKSVFNKIVYAHGEKASAVHEQVIHLKHRKSTGPASLPSIISHVAESSMLIKEALSDPKNFDSVAYKPTSEAEAGQ